MDTGRGSCVYHDIFPLTLSDRNIPSLLFVSDIRGCSLTPEIQYLIHSGDMIFRTNEIKHAVRVLSRYRDARRTRILRIRLRLTVRVKKGNARSAFLSKCRPGISRKFSFYNFIRLSLFAKSKSPGKMINSGLLHRNSRAVVFRERLVSRLVRRIRIDRNSLLSGKNLL